MAVAGTEEGGLQILCNPESYWFLWTCLGWGDEECNRNGYYIYLCKYRTGKPILFLKEFRCRSTWETCVALKMEKWKRRTMMKRMTYTYIVSQNRTSPTMQLGRSMRTTTMKLEIILNLLFSLFMYPFFHPEIWSPESKNSTSRRKQIQNQNQPCQKESAPQRNKSLQQSTQYFTFKKGHVSVPLRPVFRGRRQFKSPAAWTSELVVHLRDE